MQISNKYTLPYDVFERHKKVGSMIDDGETILDVGGAINHLSRFCKAEKIVTANLSGSEKSDVVIKKGKLPFENNSFDTVCSIDVLEHIPQEERKFFINDLLRVAKSKVILSFPIGTKSHSQHELEMLSWLDKKGEDVTYLKEHIKYKLPTLEDVKTLSAAKKSNIVFSGVIPINRFLFKLFLFDPKIKYVRRAVYYFKIFFNLITNPFLYMVLIDRKYSQSVNRAYLVIPK